MKKDLSIKELEKSRDQLRASLNLFDLAAADDAPELLKHVDLTFVKELLGGTEMPWSTEGLYPGSARFLAAIRHAQDGQRLCLDAEIDILRKVRESGVDQAHRGPFDLVETVFPVRLRGVTVLCLWSGKARTSPFTDEEIRDVARLAGVSAEEAGELAATVPVLGKKELDRASAFCARMRDVLEQALAYHLRTNELTQQLVQSERAHALGTLSGGVAHHFNNLLSVILGYSSFVQNREELSADAAEALKKITESAQRGRRLTEEILAFLGSDVEEDVPCRVHETVNSVLSLLESKTGTHVRVETRLKAANDTVIAEPSTIRQIVFNLLTNAIDSMPAGGVLSVNTANTRMITDTGEQEYLKLEVADTSGTITAGTGAPGTRLHELGDRIALKLSSVYGMVGRLDGTVVVTSEPETATRVEVLLPTAVTGAEMREERKPRRRLAPSTIWVVDDDAIFREMCRQVLSDDGHAVGEFSGGREFQDAWRSGQGRPDLILMDFSMPEYNGLQLCEWVRAEGSRVPVILVSGFAANQPDIRKALKLRKTHFLQKPFSFREMADTVTVALGETFIGE